MIVERMERHQVALYVVAIGVGVLVGLLAPTSAPGLAVAIDPVLGALLYVTFLQVPARELVRSLRAGRFLAAVLVVNFVVVPPVVAVLLGLLPADGAVRLGVALVLLAPCVDYVIVFSGLAGGSAERLVTATPLLLLLQMALLPVFLPVLLGDGIAGVVEPGPFLRAFLVLIVVPLALAWSTQAAGRVGVGLARVAIPLMVPLMMATLLVVVASQVPRVRDELGAVAAVVPVYVAFLVVMAGLGTAVARVFRLGAPDGRAVVFTGATRNSLVVLPLALALPDALAVAAVVVVTQTLVEVLGMLAYVRVVPRLFPDARA